jgi:hypothetical protein
MALDFLSAPGMLYLSKFTCIIFLIIILASSVDAERAFSGGRLQVNHLQHAMSSQTFKARVALASWVNTPFLPPGTPASIIAEASRRSKARPAGKSNGKGKAREVIIVDENGDSDSGSESN